MKQILLINDIAGYGKVGMAATLPVLSYMGIPAFCMPTALVSNTLNYGEFTQMDTTDYMRRTFPIWQHLGFHFDAISTGLMFSREQAVLVEEYCREQASLGCVIFVDPVMGDGGSLYNGIDQRQVELMRRMLGVAHLAKPNYTEACFWVPVQLLSPAVSSKDGMLSVALMLILAAISYMSMRRFPDSFTAQATSSLLCSSAVCWALAWHCLMPLGEPWMW